MAIFVVLRPYLLTTKLNCLQKNKPGHTNFPTNWNDMTFLWFDLSCSTVHVPNAGTLNCMMKKKTPKCSSSHQKLFWFLKYDLDLLPFIASWVWICVEKNSPQERQNSLLKFQANTKIIYICRIHDIRNNLI